MFVHVFGAYFGLAVSRTMYRKDIKDAEPKNCSIYHSDVFSMIGEQCQVQILDRGRSVGKQGTYATHTLKIYEKLLVHIHN